MDLKPPKNKSASSIYLRASSLATVLLLVLFGFGVFYLFNVSQKDYNAYRELVASANPVNSEAKVPPYTAKQKRKGVQKDILFTQGNDRLQLRVNSNEAVLVLDHQGESTEILEKMQDVKCLMQEELFYKLPDGREALKHSNGRLLIRGSDGKDPSNWTNPETHGVIPMQHMRFLEAESATYYYKSDRFVANQVKVTRFTVPGHQLIQNIEGLKPTMKGLAKSVEFSLADKELNFKAYQLKATFYSLGGL